MNKTINKFLISSVLLGVFALVGAFSGNNVVSADNATFTCNSATLFGTVYTNGEPTDAWFEWGPTQSMQFATPKQRFTSDSSFSQLLSPIASNTTYYWRAMAQNKFGTATGAMKSFSTSNCSTPTPNPTVSISADSTNIPFNSSTTIRWNSDNATSCDAAGNGVSGWSGSKPLDGSFPTGNLTSTKTFTIACHNSSGTSDFDSVTVTVGQQPQQNKPVVNLSADQTSLSFGGSTIIRWNPTNNPTSCQASGGTNNWSGPRSTTGGNFTTGQLSNTTTFSMTCSNDGGSSTESVTVTVGSQQVNAPNPNLTADQPNLAFNGSTIIRWNPSNNPTSCTATGGTNGWSGSRSTTGGSFTTGQLTNTVTYNMTCINSGGSLSDSVTVTVGNQVQTCQDPNALNFGGSLPCQYQQNNPLPSVDLTADDTSIDSGDSTIIRWNSNSATTSCQASGGTNNWAGLRSTSGSFTTGSLFSDRTFSITCFNSNGNSASDSVFINVDENNDNDNDGDVSVNISADDTNIDEGDSTRVRWNSTNADSCEGDGGDNGWDGRNLDEDGSFSTGELDRDTTFRITCENDDDSASDSVTIRVDDDNDNDDVSVDISADRTRIQSGSSTIIRWDSDDADECRASGGRNGWSGDRNESGTFFTGTLTSDTTYRIECENDDGDSDSDSVTVDVDNSFDVPDQPFNAPTAVTTNAINITTSSAQLNSLIFNSSGISSNAWFEWGSTPSLGNSTDRDPVGTSASVIHSDTIVGLQAGQVYYYRAVAENSAGRSNGTTLSFVTGQVGGVSTPPPTVIRTTTVINQGGGTSELVRLTIDGGAEVISSGERRTYHVEWENISNQTLRDAVLRVILPETMTFEGADDGVFSRADNTLNLSLRSLSPGEEGELFLAASAKPSLQNGELVVVVANLIFTNQAGTQDDAVAYATHRVLSGSTLGAGALFGADFLPDTFFEWLVLILLILLLIALARHLFNQFNQPRPVPPANHTHL